MNARTSRASATRTGSWKTLPVRAWSQSAPSATRSKPESKDLSSPSFRLLTKRPPQVGSAAYLGLPAPGPLTVPASTIPRRHGDPDLPVGDIGCLPAGLVLAEPAMTGNIHPCHGQVLGVGDSPLRHGP